MIPFGRMMQYGNKIDPSVTIKKVANGYMHYVVLYENGDLYGIGYNNSRQLKDCTVTYQYNSFILLSTGVQDVWCGATSTLIYTTDGKYIFNGNYNCLGTQSTINTLSSQAGDDVTSSMPPYSAIKVMSLGTNSSHYIHLTNSRVYSRGWNSDGTVGTGSTTRISAFANYSTVQMQDVYAGQYSTIFKGVDNFLYACGKSNYGEMGVASGSYNTIVRLSVPATALPFSCTDGNTMTYYTALNYYGTGWQINGQLANGVTSNQSLYTFTTPSLNLASAVKVASRCRDAQYGRTIVYAGDRFYAAGYKEVTGLPDDHEYFTPIEYLDSLDVNVDKMTIMGLGTGITLIFTGNALYATNATSSMAPGKNTDFSDRYIFSKVTLPH